MDLAYERKLDETSHVYVSEKVLPSGLLVMNKKHPHHGAGERFCK